MTFPLPQSLDSTSRHHFTHVAAYRVPRIHSQATKTKRSHWFYCWGKTIVYIYIYSTTTDPFVGVGVTIHSTILVRYWNKIACSVNWRVESCSVPRKRYHVFSLFGSCNDRLTYWHTYLCIIPTVRTAYILIPSHRFTSQSSQGSRVKVLS